MFSTKLTNGILVLLYAGIYLTHNAVHNNVADLVDAFAAAVLDPFHNDGGDAGKVEFHHIGAAAFREVKS